jgi:hypothetical protein
MHPLAKYARVPVGHRGDEVGPPGEAQGHREAVDDGADVAREARLLHGVVDHPLLRSATRHTHVPSRRDVALRRHRARGEGMIGADGADEPILEERART